MQSQHSIDDQLSHQAGERMSGGRLRALNLGALILALCWVALIAWTLHPQIDDFRNYWQAAVAILEAGNPYASTPDWSDPDVWRLAELGQLNGTTYPNPPLLAYLIVPLGMLRYEAARWIWFMLNCLALASCMVLCIRLSGSALAQRYWGLVVLGTVLAPPTRLSLQLGQISILLALMLGAVLALAQRQAPLAGLLLALTALIKLYPGLLGFYYQRQRYLQVVAWAAGTGLLIFTSSLLLFGTTP